MISSYSRLISIFCIFISFSLFLFDLYYFLLLLLFFSFIICAFFKVPGRFRGVPGGSGWFRAVAGVPVGSGRCRAGSVIYIHPLALKGPRVFFCVSIECNESNF